MMLSKNVDDEEELKKVPQDPAKIHVNIFERGYENLGS